MSQHNFYLAHQEICQFFELLPTSSLIYVQTLKLRVLKTKFAAIIALLDHDLLFYDGTTAYNCSQSMNSLFWSIKTMIIIVNQFSRIILSTTTEISFLISYFMSLTVRYFYIIFKAWDAAKGFDMKTLYKTGWTVLAIATLCSVATAYYFST